MFFYSWMVNFPCGYCMWRGNAEDEAGAQCPPLFSKLSKWISIYSVTFSSVNLGTQKKSNLGLIGADVHQVYIQYSKTKFNIPSAREPNLSLHKTWNQAGAFIDENIYLSTLRVGHLASTSFAQIKKFLKGKPHKTYFQHIFKTVRK